MMHRLKKWIPFLVLLLFLPLVRSGDGAPKDRWWQVYFTRPESSIKSEQEAMVHAFIGFIRSARKSFYGSFYDLSSKKIAEALRTARDAGVDVRLVIEKDTLTADMSRMLADGNIPVVTDERPGLMHNKFAVVDGCRLWTGSYNLTDNCSYRNNNNALRIDSPDLAAIYTGEFFEMFTEKIFGNRKDYGPFAPLRNRHYVKIENSNINIYFSPEDNVERIILKRIKKAKESIYFMIFSFTSEKIAHALIEKAHNGITVHGVFEKDGARSAFSQFTKLKLEDVNVAFDKNRYKMHHKVMIIDRCLVLTGSYNYSKSANKKNDENLIIIENREIANEYLKEFGMVYK